MENADGDHLAIHHISLSQVNLEFQHSQFELLVPSLSSGAMPTLTCKRADREFPIDCSG
jgi:hypothetical protein